VKALGAAWIPDPVSGRWLRRFAIAAVVACGLVMCLSSSKPSGAPSKPIARPRAAPGWVP
jgi:hypothetical protein